jgi:hypothetical protein
VRHGHHYLLETLKWNTEWVKEKMLEYYAVFEVNDPGYSGTFLLQFKKFQKIVYLSAEISDCVGSV